MLCPQGAQTEREPAEVEVVYTSLPPTVAQTVEQSLRGHRLADGGTLYGHWKEEAAYSACCVREL